MAALTVHPQPAGLAGLPGASAPGQRNPRRILDSFKPEGLAVTPAFAAYMIEHGYRTYLEAQDGVGFALWNAERWEEFCRRQPGRDPMCLLPIGDDRARFLDWLEDRANDHIARNKVEAAA